MHLRRRLGGWLHPGTVGGKVLVKSGNVQLDRGTDAADEIGHLCSVTDRGKVVRASFPILRRVEGDTLLDAISEAALDRVDPVVENRHLNSRAWRD